MNLKPSHFLRPTSDLVFKRIFGEHPDLIKSFLNSLLPLPCPIETIQYLPPEEVPRIPILKNTIVDVKCTDQQGRIFIVEMQMEWSDSFSKRFLYGVSKAFVKQLDSGHKYDALCPIYGLAIVDAIFEKHIPDWYHHYKMRREGNYDKTLQGLEMVFVELPKFSPRDRNDRQLRVLWLRFLKEINEDIREVPEEMLGNPCIEKALELAQEAAYTKGQLETYDRFLDALRVEKTIQSDAHKKGLREGREEGRVEGRVEGRAEGIAEGIEIGKEEERKFMIQVMHNNGMSAEQIAKGLGMDNEAVIEILENK